ncbi:MAG: Uncharacterised protein [Opitutia bacterium UBA7350]|nr:MAG: Uncharacterised protein [Opitutae bacterium UBA7350]
MSDTSNAIDAANLESVLITGCGYIGTALAEHLLQKRVKVGALTRNRMQAARLIKLGLSEVLVDDLDSDQWHERLRNSYKMVVNCVSSAGGGLVGYQKSYLEGQRSLLKWACGAQPDVICYTSSTSVYPQNTGDWVDETATTEPMTERSSILLQAEQLLLQDKAFMGKKYVVRLGGIYGPGRHYLIDRIKGEEAVLPGGGEHHMNLVHQEDAVRGIIAVLEASLVNKSDIFNLCDAEPSTQGEIANWIASRLQLPCPKFDPMKKSPRMQRSNGSTPDRKISSKKITNLTKYLPKYPSYKTGYLELL